MDLNIQRLPTVVLLPTMLLAVFVLVTAQALDLNLMDLMRNKNCSRYLHLQNDDENVSHHSLMCPPWYVETNDSSSRCTNELMVHNEVYFMEGTQQPWMESLFCMTTSPNASSPLERDVVGSCLFSFHTYNLSFSTYYPLPCNISELNDYMCAGLNREGQLCGKCVKGFAPPVFSYSLNCVECTDYHLNWLKYVGVAFGPLTIFCLFICFFHVSAASPYLHGIVFYSQILSAPIIIRLVSIASEEDSTSVKLWGSFYVSALSFWNLDIFRASYQPFCLHPSMTILQALALDYLVAIYPLVLLLIALALVSLHSRGNTIAVTLWRPFSLILRPCIRHLNIQTQLLKSFATLFYLSAMKMQSVSLDLLSPTPLYHVYNKMSDKFYLLLAGDVEYFGKEHLPYALLALLFLTLFTLVPALLLFLYPLETFQKFLNKTKCNSPKLRIIMDVFQGHYKDGTNNTRDYRFFSGMFFISRFAVMAVLIMFTSYFSIMVFGAIVTMLGFSVAFTHPQRTKVHYILDGVAFVLLSLCLFAIIGTFLNASSIFTWRASSFFNLVVVLGLPVLYIIALASYFIVARKQLPQGCLRTKELIGQYFCRSSESQPLLTCHN